MLSSLATSAVFALLYFTPSTSAIGTALGFGSSTVGGGSAPAVTPTSNAQLISYLSDSTPRVIVLNKVFDFTTYYGSKTGKVCKPWTCSNGNTPQVAIDSGGNWCQREQPKAPTGTETYYNSGTSFQYSLKVGSKKTILGKGANSGIKGIGLLIQNVDNVIVQNIQITDINAKFVWGGDAITIVGSSNVWIDHNYIKNIGRQFIVTGYNPAKSVTISNNVFDGRTQYSAVCNGQHYWAFLFTGSADTITFTQNHVYQTSGRGPHIGGTSGYTQYLHIVNNYFDNIKGHAVDAEIGAVALTEGNYFNSVTTPDLTGSNSNGNEFFIQSSTDAATCKASLGRACLANTLANSGAVAGRTSNSVLSALKSQPKVAKYNPMTAQAAATYVQAHAGVGIIN